MIGTLIMWTIYCRPRDFPNAYVVRRWSVRAGVAIPDPEPTAVTATLSLARSQIPDGLYCLRRDPADEAAIVETWF